MLAVGSILGPNMASEICQMTHKMAPKTSQSNLPSPKDGPLDPQRGTHDPQDSPQVLFRSDGQQLAEQIRYVYQCYAHAAIHQVLFWGHTAQERSAKSEPRYYGQSSMKLQLKVAYHV